MSTPDWRHRAHAADDLLADIAAVCRGEMPAEAREGGSEAHRAAWDAVCALRVEAATMRTWAEEAAKAENENAEDVRRERAAVGAFLLSRAKYMKDDHNGVDDACWAEVALIAAAMDIERGEHRREEAE